MPHRIDHQPFYCEENIWRLCQSPLLEGCDPHAVFVTSRAGHFPIRNQRVAAPGRITEWDYHVVALAHRDSGTEIWDLDCRLGAPLLARDWLFASFRRLEHFPVEEQPLFRIVPAAILRETFRSDRSHMRSEDGEYRHPPPPWPPIGLAPGETGSNLSRFLDPDDDWIGELLTLAEARERWGS